MRLRFTDRAEHDLLAIWEYIAADNPEAADRMVETFRATADMLMDFPRLGPAFSKAPLLRYMPVGHYLLIYRLAKAGVEITRVVHGARYMPRQ